jgi:hypothetical protein
MKVFLLTLGLAALVLLSAFLLRAQAESVPTGEEARLIPIAPGVWYPQDGPVPERAIRYYRVRCWPGCHRGSPYGKYPEEPLDMRPIFPTSTVGAHHGVN